MPDEHQLTLRQVDQVRGDLYGITEELEIIQMRLASSPNCQRALTKC
jgi:hypothetical protein